MIRGCLPGLQGPPASIGGLYFPLHLSSHGEMRSALLTLLLAFGPGCSKGDALDALLLKMKDPAESVRGDAIWELEKVRDPRAARAVTAALGDSSRNIRVSAAMVLQSADGEGPEVVEALCRATRDSDPQVREWAIYGLERIADPGTLAVLLAAKTDPDADVRRNAAKAIHGIDAALQARSVRHHLPAVVPLELSREEDRKIYLKAHEDEWLFVVSRISDNDMAGATLPVSTGTICEAPPVVTRGAYLGQSDASDFLLALQRRCKRDPQVLSEFRSLRDSALKRFPPPKTEEESEK